MKNELESIIAKSPAFSSFEEQYIKLLATHAKALDFKTNDVIVNEGDTADSFYLIFNERVAVNTHLPNRGTVTLQTLEKNELIGWSWLLPPYEWRFSVVALANMRLLKFDGKALKKEMDKDPRFGYLILQDFFKVMAERLRATRLQLTDVYSHPEQYL